MNDVTSGSISGGGVHALNSSIALQAYPANNWKFLNWNGTITNYTTTGHQANPWTGITVTQDVTYQANFGQVTNGFVYHLLDQYDPPQVEIIGYEGPTNKKVIIPTTIDGYKVTSIATGAFLNNGVTNLSVSSNVVHIASSGIGVGILEFVGIAAGFAFAADAFKDMLEADMVDMAADVAADLMDDFRYRREMLGPIEVWGLDRFDPNWMVVKGQIKTRPLQQWSVARAFNLRLKRKMDEAGIEIPVPQMRVYTSSKDSEGQPLRDDEMTGVIVPADAHVHAHQPVETGAAGAASRGAHASAAAHAPLAVARDVSHEPRPAPPSTGTAPTPPQIPTAGEAGVKG